MIDIKSAGSQTLTTPGLSEFKRLLEQARLEHDEIVRELSKARSEESISVERYTSWKNGWLFRKIFTIKFCQLQQLAEESTAKRVELEEQEYLSRLQTQISIPEGIANTFHRMNDDFDVLTKSYRIWDTIAERNTNRVIERTTATRTITRKQVHFKLGHCTIIESEWKVPHLENANGGDIFFYPAFAIYFISPENFALLEYKDIKLKFSTSSFIEEEKFSDDSTVIGYTWAKTNKDGSPDKRFKDNYQIPIVQYGIISIRSASGMNEEYMVSYPERAEAFSIAWNEHANAVSNGQ